MEGLHLPKFNFSIRKIKLLMNETRKNILVIGTGTIGEPLIGLLSRIKETLQIGEVIFHKRTPLKHERPKVESLVKNGAILAVDEINEEAFRALGHDPKYSYEKALEISDVVIDCTPAGNANKASVYEKLSTGKVFIAQGSEKGFGVPYALGINDDVLSTREDVNYIQIVSCNTHTISRLIKTLTSGDLNNLISGDFVCIRRANDISQDGGFVPAVACDKHSEDVFGTHHARDVNDLFGRKTVLPVFSSSLKTNTQYMHSVRFSLVLRGKYTKDQIIKSFESDPYVCTTSKRTTNSVFSFGRDHGFYGRIYSQVVVSLPTLSVTSAGNMTRVVGCVFTPQDANSLLSSVAATAWSLHGKDYREMWSPNKFLTDEV